MGHGEFLHAFSLHAGVLFGQVASFIHTLETIIASGPASHSLETIIASGHAHTAETIIAR